MNLGSYLAEYRRVVPWDQLAPETTKTYRRSLMWLHAHMGDDPIDGISRQKLIIRLNSEPRRGLAYQYRSMIMMVFGAAFMDGKIPHNPAVQLPVIDTGSHEPWSDADIGKHFPVLRRRNYELYRVAMMALYTGQRLGDLIRIEWSQVYRDRVMVTQRKTGVTLNIPIHDRLKPVLAVPAVDEHVLVNLRHWKWSIPGFYSAWRRAGMDLTIHGLRATCANKLLEAGATDAEVMAILGHKTTAMVRRYSMRVNRDELARNAMRKWEMAA